MMNDVWTDDRRILKLYWTKWALEFVLVSSFSHFSGYEYSAIESTLNSTLLLSFRIVFDRNEHSFRRRLM